MASFSLSDRLKSFYYAFCGATTLLRTQPNTRLHLIASLVAVVAGFWLKISRGEWALIAVAIAMVWTAEAFNTAIEFLADEVTLEKREGIKNAKDVAAFGVLASAAAAAVIGGLVFLPHIFVSTP